jgi:protein Tex
MNNNIIKEISINLNIREVQVENTLKLLSDGNTIPFIARYRKEVTGNLDEEQIRSISEVYEYQVNLLKRKEEVIRLIDEKGLLTDELKNKIMECNKLVEVEDLYRPFKEKKKTKATDAINNGLEPLAKIMMSFPKEGDINSLANKYINDKVKDINEAIMGAKYIIAEWISDNAFYRKWIRGYTLNNGILVSKLKKNAKDDNKVYEMYYEYKESVNKIKPHRVLAVNRGEKEGVLSVGIDIDKENILNSLESRIIKDNNSFVVDYIKEAIEDSYKRLIEPSIERELRSELTEISEDAAIDVFSHNVEKLLLQPPMKEKIVLGLDPAYRTGCKLAVIDGTGKVLDISVIYPHEPKNEKEKSKKHVMDLINKYNVDIIAIGNGTASRESEAFIAELIKECDKKVSYIIVNEAGASVYSASKLAIAEFPDLHVEERSAISIARRLQDPLSELVKIDTKSIGVGEYQHDVEQKKLNESLDFVVTKTVNQVGVNINTASSSLLKYVAGLNKKTIDNIITYRDKNGKITSRGDIKKIASDKVFEQSVGFMRIIDGINPLDKTSIHPESYNITNKLLNKLNLNLEDIGTNKLQDALNNIDIESLVKELNTDHYTLEDIINSLKQPNRDLRDDFVKPLLKSDILKIEDLKVGMKLQGTVRNVVDFGVFIDIGLKNDGLAHISKLTNKYINHPKELLSVGDIVDCYVDDIFQEKNKVSLSLLEPKINN